MERIYCIVIGYLFGNILNAAIVTKLKTGRSISEFGADGNPGMANVMAHVGFKEGVLVLAGDIAKCVVASIICWLLFKETLGRLVFLYTNLGTSLGHCYPFWRHFKGGKAVVTICCAVILYNPFWGLLASIIGLIVVLITKFLSIGGVAIPAAFTVIAFPLFGLEAGFVSLLLTILSFTRHYTAMVRDLHGEGKKTDLIGKLKNK